MEIKVLKKEQSRSGYFYNHKALIEIEGDIDIKGDKEKIIYETSIKVGYHPLGYGLYGGSLKHVKENQYLAVFQTGTHCD